MRTEYAKSKGGIKIYKIRQITSIVLVISLLLCPVNPYQAQAANTAKTVTTPRFNPYKVPLSADLQWYTYKICRQRKLSFTLVMAVMKIESSYRVDAISKTNDYGIMQINQFNHNWLKSKLGITNFLDARQNINAGTFMLADIAKKYSNAHQILMVYNMGEANAKKLWKQGVYSSSYSKKVVSAALKLRK